MSHNLKALLREAMELDEEEKFVAAFFKYIETIRTLFSKMFDETEGFDNSKVESHLKLAYNCLERASETFKLIGDAPIELPPGRKEAASEIRKQTASDALPSFGKLEIDSKISQGSSERNPNRRSLTEELQTLKSEGPVSLQKHINSQMWATFNNKIQELKRQGRPISPELNIAFARRLQESLFEAEVQEKSLRDNLYAKYKESTAENTKGILRDLLSKRVQFKKIRPKDISSKIKKIVESSAEKKPKEQQKLTEELTEALESSSFILQPLLTLLLSNKHPLSQEFIQFMEKAKKEFASIRKGDQDSNQILTVRIQAIQEFLYSFIELIQQCFELFSNEDSVLRCHFTIHKCLFNSPLYSALMGFFKSKYSDRDKLISEKISKITWDYNLSTLKIRDRFKLGCTDNSYSWSIEPYEKSIMELRQIGTFTEPLEKIQCLVRVNESICHAIACHHLSKGSKQSDPDFAIGSEDLHAICAYVVVKANVPFVISELMFIAEFIPDNFILGEEGYALATMQSALESIESI